MKLNVFITSMDEFKAMNEAYNEIFSKFDQKPVSRFCSGMATSRFDSICIVVPDVRTCSAASFWCQSRDRLHCSFESTNRETIGMVGVVCGCCSLRLCDSEEVAIPRSRRLRASGCGRGLTQLSDASLSITIWDLEPGKITFLHFTQYKQHKRELS